MKFTSIGRENSMESIYTVLLEKLKARKFAEIHEPDYLHLVNSLSIEYLAHNVGGDPVSPEYVELRQWVYERVAKDMVYQRTGYLNDHFCIGAIFGILRMFDAANSDNTFTLCLIDETGVKNGVD